MQGLVGFIQRAYFSPLMVEQKLAGDGKGDLFIAETRKRREEKRGNELNRSEQRERRTKDGR